MTTQPENIKPNGPDEITSLIMVKTILEHWVDELQERRWKLHNAGMPMATSLKYSELYAINRALALVQAYLVNDLEGMGEYRYSDPEDIEIHQEDEKPLLEDRLQDAISALCPNSPGLAFIVWQTSVKMIEEAKSTGRRIFAFPQTQANTGPNRAQRRQTVRKKK